MTMTTFDAGTPTSRDATPILDAFAIHGGVAYGLARRILRDPFLAEDAVQDAFVKLWAGDAQFDPSRGSMRALLLTVTHHTSIDVVRRRSRHERTAQAYSLGASSASSASEEPGRAIEIAEDAREVRSALSTLPEAQRSVVELVYFSGFTGRRIADELGIPLGTVKSRLRMGLKKLSFALGDGVAMARPDRETRRRDVCGGAE